MTLVVATMMLSLTGCQTCSNWTRQLTGSVQGCFGRLGNCSLGNCRLGGANNVGAPCDAGCESAHGPMSPMDGGACSPCGESSANYGSYDGVVIGSYDGIPTGATISTPSSSVPSSGISSGSYIGSPTPAGIRGETIVPKPAN
ncbi:MAG: hypothetical protein MUF23_17485 [Pirellula sp.]|nr:hypothetical protein [Pirellula sp.]